MNMNQADSHGLMGQWREIQREREDRTQNEGFAKMVIHTGYIWLMVGISYPAFLAFLFVCLALILYICVRAHGRG